MASKYKESKELNFAKIASEILAFWEREEIFQKSVDNRAGAPAFTFYEGPPSANGTPGIHHVMGRTVKDIFCRFKTLQGYQVKRKGGWDTHGLPVELQVEKKLGITKEDIGKKISIEAYNQACRETVMTYKDEWDHLTRKMGYWVNLENPYVTYETSYIESLWWILKQLYDRNLLYKGYTIQPYSPAAGTGLSSHELNLPGTYKDVKDTSVVAQFKVIHNEHATFLYQALKGWDADVYILAWTTTPWTLPANTALTIGEKIRYVQINTFNPYTHRPVSVVLAKDLTSRYFDEKNLSDDLSAYVAGDKHIPYQVVQEFPGAQLVGIRYEQLMPFLKPIEAAEHAFQVISGDFVTTEDGTGVVHTSPTFGADDFRVARQHNIPSLTVRDDAGNEVPVVDRKGKFIAAIGKRLAEKVGQYKIKTHRPLGDDDFYVKNYTNEDEKHPDYKSTDVIISIILKEENKAFKVEKYEHTYPHCWRTDKPVLYYPLDSWFIRTTAMKERMVALNKTINWKPESTGTGRFGNWLENLVDWNLSRSRFWGTPLPIWRTADGREEICIGSIEELRTEADKALKAGVLKDALPEELDLHRPFVDDIILVSPSGKPMYREPDLVDVWFDSGAMPYAQWHFPFENKEIFDQNFPADFIAEGVDQTRGWFFTLHAIAALLFDQVAFKNVVSNGLVLDKNGNKMSKRLGNVVNPFDALDKYGADVVRWYMIENAPPWENLKFNPEGIVESQRRFFGTLLNTYSFFALYANIDGYTWQSDAGQRKHPLDRWIISKLHSLIKDVTNSYDQYDPTTAARALQDFVNDHLSNWYVRLNRKRFWKGEMTADKKAAYQTLHDCLMVVAQLMSPIAPFFSDWLYQNLITGTSGEIPESIHLTDLRIAEPELIDHDLERAMGYAQKISSLVHSLRKNAKIKVRTPLSKILLPVVNVSFAQDIKIVEDIILSEVNVKQIDYIDDTSGILIKRVKPNFAKLGKQYGPKLKEVTALIQQLTQEEIQRIEKDKMLHKNGYDLVADDVLISSEDIPGWTVAVDNELTVALDINLTDELKREGIARDFVNRIQNLRKDMGLEVLDKIGIEVERDGEMFTQALTDHMEYIRNETQALSLDLMEGIEGATQVDMEDFSMKVKINLLKRGALS